MRINHRQIDAFRAVFQTSSMTAAGALMGITQPAVSRLIRDLEAEMALTLFDRSAGRLTPTPDAVALFREVERSYQGLDRVAHAAAELGRRREGELRIAASVAPSFYGLPAGADPLPVSVAGRTVVLAHSFLAGGVGPCRDATLRPGCGRTSGGSKTSTA